MMNVSDRILNAIDKAIGGPPLDPSEALARVVIRESGVAVATEKEIKNLRELQRAGEHTLSVMNAHTQAAAVRDYPIHLRELQRAIGEGQDVSRLDGWDPRDFKEDYHQKMTAAKAEYHRLISEVATIATTIFVRLNKASMGLADEVEKADRGTYSRFGLPYQPTPLVETLRAVGTRRVTGLPKQALPFLEL